MRIMYFEGKSFGFLFSRMRIFLLIITIEFKLKNDKCKITLDNLIQKHGKSEGKEKYFSFLSKIYIYEFY